VSSFTPPPSPPYPMPPVGGWSWEPPGLPSAPAYRALPQVSTFGALPPAASAGLPVPSLAIPMPTATPATAASVYAMPPAAPMPSPSFLAPTGYAAPFGQTPLLPRPPAPLPTQPLGTPTAAAGAPLPPPPTAAVAAGATPTAARASGSVGRLSRLGTGAAGALSTVGGSRALPWLARAGRVAISPWGAPFLADPLGDAVGGRPGAALEMGLAGAAVGGRFGGWPGAAIGAAAGGLAGGVGGFELEDIPWVGGIFGGGESKQGLSDDDFDELRTRYSDILGRYGAPQPFIDQAVTQFRLAYDVMGGDEMETADANALAEMVLGDMIRQLQIEQQGGPLDPYGDARTQLADARQYDLAQIAATQAWVEPLVENIVAQQQGYVDQTAAAHNAMAAQITDPAVRAALEAVGHQMSSQQAAQSAMIAQQVAYEPDAMRAQLDAQYQSILQDLALQEAQYNNEILAAGGTLPGQPPIVGGIPLAPAGAVASVAPVGVGPPPQPVYLPLPGPSPSVAGESPLETPGNVVANVAGSIADAGRSVIDFVPGIFGSSATPSLAGNTPRTAAAFPVPAPGSIAAAPTVVRDVAVLTAVGNLDRLAEYLDANFEASMYPDEQRRVADIVREATGHTVEEIIAARSGVPPANSGTPPPTGTTTPTTAPPPMTSRSLPPVAAGTVPPIGPPTSAPPSEQAIVDHSTTVRWMRDLIGQGMTRDAAIGYAVANGLDPAAAARAYDAANQQTRSVPRTGTTVPTGR
jgi:hypothetical protein